MVSVARKTLPFNYPERSGLTANQLAAVLSALTDRKQFSVINAPVGPGRRGSWSERTDVGWGGTGPLIGITPSQSTGAAAEAGVTPPAGGLGL